MPQCLLVVCEGVSHSWSAGALVCAGCLTLYDLSDLLSDCAEAAHAVAPQGEPSAKRNLLAHVLIMPYYALLALIRHL